jgi:hypothetical protein
MCDVSPKPESTSFGGQGHRCHDEDNRPASVTTRASLPLGKFKSRHNLEAVFFYDVAEAAGTETRTIDGDRRQGGRHLFEARIQPLEKRRHVVVSESALRPERSQRDVTDATVQCRQEIFVRRTQVGESDDGRGKANLDARGSAPDQGKVAVDAMHVGIVSRVGGA